MADNILDSLDYYSLLDAALKNKTDAVLSNGKPEHARFIIQRFLEHAKGTVRLFSGELKRKFDDVQIYESATIINAARGFLAHDDTRLAILLQKNIDAEGGDAKIHPLIHALHATAQWGDLKGKLEVRRVSAEDWQWLCDAGFSYHWMVMDTDAYRLETECEKAKASVNFGDQKMAEGLARLFDRLFDSGDSIFPLPA